MLGCGVSVLVESAIPFVPTLIASLEKYVYKVDKITKGDLFLMAGMEFARIGLGVSAYSALMNQDMGIANSIFVGAVFYLSAGVAEVIYSASKVADYRRNNPRR